MYIDWHNKLLACLLLVTLAATSVFAQALPQEKLVGKASGQLALLDKGQYEEAWFSMSEMFREFNEKNSWEKTQQTIRDAYGALLARKVNRTSFRQSYKNSPDGQYVIIQFKTVFLHKASAVETVVLDCNQGEQCSIREYIIN